MKVAMGFKVNQAKVTETIQRANPYIKTLLAFSRPEGIGLLEVLVIKLSMFLS
jgi:hypothetical protein